MGGVWPRTFWPFESSVRADGGDQPGSKPNQQGYRKDEKPGRLAIHRKDTERNGNQKTEYTGQGQE